MDKQKYEDLMYYEYEIYFSQVVYKCNPKGTQKNKSRYTSKISGILLCAFFDSDINDKQYIELRETSDRYIDWIEKDLFISGVL